MKDFQEYTTFITGAGSSIELDVEQALLDEVADVAPVNVAEETLKADMDDLANTRKKITDTSITSPMPPSSRKPHNRPPIVLETIRLITKSPALTPRSKAQVGRTALPTLKQK